MGFAAILAPRLPPDSFLRRTGSLVHENAASGAAVDVVRRRRKRQELQRHTFRLRHARNGTRFGFTSNRNLLMPLRSQGVLFTAKPLSLLAWNEFPNCRSHF